MRMLLVILTITAIAAQTLPNGTITVAPGTEVITATAIASSPVQARVICFITPTFNKTTSTKVKSLETACYIGRGLVRSESIPLPGAIGLQAVEWSFNAYGGSITGLFLPVAAVPPGTQGTISYQIVVTGNVLATGKF